MRDARTWITTAAAALPAAALLAPWWLPAQPTVLLIPGPARSTTDVLRGADVLGATRTTVLVTLAAVTVLAALAGLRWAWARPASRPLALVTGAVAVGCAGVGLIGFGPGAGGGWLGGTAAAVAGTVAVVGAMAMGTAATGTKGTGTGRLAVVGLAAIVAAVGTVAVGGGPETPAPVKAGPFVQLTGLSADELRSGLPGLPASAFNRLVTVGDGSAVATPEGLARIDTAGRAQVLARFPADRWGYPARGIVGAAAGRVAWLASFDTVAVRGLDPADPVAVEVTGVGDAGQVGADGTLLLRAQDDPAGTFRVLDLRALTGAATTPATALPALPLPAAARPDDVRVTDLPPHAGTARRSERLGAGYQLQRLSPGPAGPAIATLAGGPDPTCGLTRSATLSFLPAVIGPTVDPAGHVWFVVTERYDTPGRLVRLTPDGELRAVPEPVPGPVVDLVATAAGGIDLLLDDPGRPALWRLPVAAGALAELPAPPPGCVAAPTPLAPPVQLLPVADVAHDPLGVLLAADGHWASAAAGRGSTPNALSVVDPDGTRTPLGPRLDGNLGRVWPDGSGGVWWLEAPRDSPTPLTLVHARPGGDQQRYPPVPHPAPREGATLLPDLSGAPPLLGTAVGAFRIDRGRAEPVLPGTIAGGAVRPDGRGWVLADGRLVTLERGRVLAPVIDAGSRRTDDAPVTVQLARGVPPGQLALPRADLALDERGRAVVVSDGTLLAVDDGGRVRVVAQDDRVDAVATVEGGFAVYDEGRQLRVRLPG